MQLSTYLFFNGNCHEAFKFYERVLGGKIGAVHTYEGMPAGPGNAIPPEWKSKIMNMTLTVDGQVLLGSDTPPEHQEKAVGGFSVCLSLNDIVRAERIFRALAENGTVTMEFQPTFWAERFGMVMDQFGTPWMINCEKAA